MFDSLLSWVSPAFGLYQILQVIISPFVSYFLYRVLIFMGQILQTLILRRRSNSSISLDLHLFLPYVLYLIIC